MSDDDPRAAERAPGTLESPAWLMRSPGTHGAVEGTLSLAGDRLSFREHGADSPVFDVALADVGNVRFPRYNLGSVMRFDAAGERHRVAFMKSRRRSRWSGARLSDVRPARRFGRQWRDALGPRG